MINRKKTIEQIPNLISRIDQDGLKIFLSQQHKFEPDSCKACPRIGAMANKKTFPCVPSQWTKQFEKMSMNQFKKMQLFSISISQFCLSNKRLNLLTSRLKAKVSLKFFEFLQSISMPLTSKETLPSSSTTWPGI